MDRPELRGKIREILVAMDNDSVSKHGLHGYMIKNYADQILVLRPIEEEIRKQEGDLLLSEKLLEVGRLAIEGTLIEWRDSRLSEFNRGNGLVIREKDGKDSSIIRFGPEVALKIGIEAMIRQALKEGE